MSCKDEISFSLLCWSQKHSESIRSNFTTILKHTSVVAASWLCGWRLVTPGPWQCRDHHVTVYLQQEASFVMGLGVHVILAKSWPRLQYTFCTLSPSTRPALRLPFPSWDPVVTSLTANHIFSIFNRWHDNHTTQNQNYCNLIFWLAYLITLSFKSI
jgi:hypothetical protein